MVHKKIVNGQARSLISSSNPTNDSEEEPEISMVQKLKYSSIVKIK